MKRVLSVIMAIGIFMCVFSSCSEEGEARYPLTVNGTPIDSEIFSYYLDSVWDSPEAMSSKEGRITEATYKCIRYVAVNSTFASYGLSLTEGEKAEISDETNVLWNTFGEHYKSIGVGKETFLKIRTSEEYIEKLRIAFFDKGGSDEISDGVLRGVLTEEFAAFRYVRTPLKDTDVYGNERQLTEAELSELSSIYTSAANTATGLYSVESAYNSISEKFPLSEMSYETAVIDRTDHRFTEVFFNKVKSMKENTSTVFQYEGYVYMVHRINILSEPAIFSDKRSECLRIISEEPLQSKINLMCNAYHSVRDSALVGEYYSEVGKNR